MVVVSPDTSCEGMVGTGVVAGAPTGTSWFLKDESDSWSFEKGGNENPYLSSQLDPRVDSTPRSENGLHGHTTKVKIIEPVDRPLLKAHKQLPRRGHTNGGANLRSQFKSPTNGILDKSPVNLQARTPPSPPNISPAPALLPTPPNFNQEPSEYGFDDSSNAETAILRSGVVTPINQRSPPTPDITPPQFDPFLKTPPFLGTQPSFSSTKAESFRTAREDISSDDELEGQLPAPESMSHSSWKRAAPIMKSDRSNLGPSPLGHLDNTAPTRPDGSDSAQNGVEVFQNQDKLADNILYRDYNVGTSLQIDDSELQAPDTHELTNSSSPLNHDLLENDNEVGNVSLSDETNLPTPTQSVDDGQETPPLSYFPRRGQSLRDRLEESKKIESRPSTEKFADEIGWSRSTKVRTNSWRLSGVSTTSTVEAIVVDTEPKRKPTLRHQWRNSSLRSASSPVANSNRSSLLSNPDSPHRLVHKKARLTNQNRWSMGSEASRSLSVSSSTAAQPRAPIIRVAVIPERRSSLRSSAENSKRHSVSLSVSSGGQRHSITSRTRDGNFELHQHRNRAMSETLPTSASFANRGRDGRFPPTVPPRSSSMSAPTSRSNSRANSMTSEHLRLRRAAAEEDVRKTLARMESERTIPVVQADRSSQDQQLTPQSEGAVESWAILRPPSPRNTPFSQPSVNSASPGPVEMGQARTVNFFPHNNHSLQLIENSPLPESRAVQGLYTSGRDLQVAVDEPSTPIALSRPTFVVDSPLRNPREPPMPPQFQIIPPTPAALTPTEHLDRPSEINNNGRSMVGRRFGSLRRPSMNKRRYSDSFMKSISRSLSLKDARNKKADQDLDGNLHPFWRPRGFWDDFSDTDFESDALDRDLFVNNSLGMPQKRMIFDGPLSLVRRISDGSRRRRQNRGITKRLSYGSLSKLQAGRKLHKIPGLGIHFQIISLRDLQDRVLSAKKRKEDEKLEKRRENLRRSIGASVISRGDSRYPAMPMSAGREGTGP